MSEFELSLKQVNQTQRTLQKLWNFIYGCMHQGGTESFSSARAGVQMSLTEKKLTQMYYICVYGLLSFLTRILHSLLRC